MSVIVNQLTKVYGTQIAVNHISFTAEPGKIVGFLGPNGAGKSTTMKMITGFIPPSDGTASVCGFDINTQSMDVRKCLGYLPENNPLYLDMYVKEFLAFVAGLQQLNNVESRIKEMIEQTGLEREQYKKISQLSKGYRQRVGLAQAMLHDPKVLILDEPTTGLDPNQLVEIRNVIKNAGKDKTVFLSTHIMQEVEAICGRVIIIDKGKIVADKQLEKLISESATQIIEVEFDQKVNETQIATIENISSYSNIDGAIWELTFATDKDMRPVVFDFATANGLKTLQLSQKNKNLGDFDFT